MRGDDYYESLGEFRCRPLGIASRGLAEIRSAVDCKVVARESSAGLGVSEIVEHARNVGGPALRTGTSRHRSAEKPAFGVKIGDPREIEKVMRPLVSLAPTGLGTIAACGAKEIQEPRYESDVTKSPNNVNLSEDRQVALEGWYHGYTDWT
jgi:hypothetical protein